MFDSFISFEFLTGILCLSLILLFLFNSFISFVFLFSYLRRGISSGKVKIDKLGITDTSSLGCVIQCDWEDVSRCFVIGDVIFLFTSKKFIFILPNSKDLLLSIQNNIEVIELKNSS